MALPWLIGGAAALVGGAIVAALSEDDKKPSNNRKSDYDDDDDDDNSEELARLEYKRDSLEEKAEQMIEQVNDSMSEKTAHLARLLEPYGIGEYDLDWDKDDDDYYYIDRPEIVNDPNLANNPDNFYQIIEAYIDYTKYNIESYFELSEEFENDKLDYLLDLDKEIKKLTKLLND